MPGPEGHRLRGRDTPALYDRRIDTSVAISYGATVMQGTFIKDILVEPDGVQIITSKDVVYRSEYVIDAGGMKSILAQKSDLVKGLAEVDPYGFVLTDKPLMTSQPGLFAAGDVRAGSTKQAAAATGEGATAALMIREYLREVD